MAVVSRLVLNHPALGAVGGAGLHSQVEALYQKIGDAIASRWFQLTDFDQTETVDLEHNFDMDIENLRYDIYVYTGGQWVLVTATSTPARSDFSVIEKVGDEDNTLQITNNTGGNDLLAAVVLMNDPLYLSTGDVKDVSISSPLNGQVLTYNNGTSKWENAAPAASKNFTLFVGSGEAYTTLGAAIAAASPGDSILVIDDTAEAAGDLALNVADVRVEWMPGAVTTLSGALTNGLQLTAARIKLVEMGLKLEPSGAQARGISIEAADCEVDRATLELNTAQTLTDGVHITSGGTRAYAKVRIKATLGTITNGLTNNDGASEASVWG